VIRERMNEHVKAAIKSANNGAKAIKYVDTLYRTFSPIVNKAYAARD